MRKILIIVCSSTLNRGTEALVRGTITLLENAFGKDFEVVLASAKPEIDSKQKLPHVTNYIYRIAPQYSNILSRIICKIKKICKIQCLNIDILLSFAKQSDLVLEVGADNYDLAYNLYPSLRYINKKLRNACKGKIFLYDCSLDQESVNKDFLNEISLFDAVSIREIQTQENIANVKPELKIPLIPDPAFIMQSHEVRLPDFWKENKMIGVNLSSLIVGSNYGNNLEEKVMKCYQYMIDNLIATTDLNVVLIPHVMAGADLVMLKQIKDMYRGCSRVNVILNENYSAPELKFIISKCRFFVGARTHATIAAYSSCVPTIVLGYSTKSIGIAKDLYNKSDGYVVSVQNISSVESLWNPLKRLIDNEKQEREHLKNIMPQYQKKAFKMSELFKELVNNEPN